MPQINLPNSCTAAGVKIADVLYAVVSYSKDGKKILFLITVAGPIAIPATAANMAYLKGLGITIYTLSSQQKPLKGIGNP